MIARVAFALCVPLFALCVAVQFNDPDPVPWIAVYACAGLACAFAAARVRVVEFASVVAVIAAVWALSLAPSALSFLRGDKEAMAFTMKTGDAEEEEARECGGLVLVVVACSAAGVVDVRRRKKRLSA